MREKLKQFSNNELRDLILVVLEINDSYSNKSSWMMDNEDLYGEMLDMLDLMEVEEE